MPGSGQASPTCAHNNPVNVNDGTLCRAQSPAPGSVGFHPLDSLSSAALFLGGEFESAKSHLRGTVDNVERHLRSDYEGAKCIYDAYELALDLAPEAILKETGYEISSLLSALIPGLLQMVVVVGATTFLGAAIGGIVGFLFGGVGAIPGAAVGGELGLDLGVAILTWLGVAFLVVSIAKGFVEMLDALRNGIEWAWATRILPKAAEAKQVSAAAHELARTVGILFRLIPQAIVVYLLKKAAVGATRGATTTAGAVQAEGAAAVSDATVAELVGKLRSSKFGGRFATWVEENWRDMVKNPRLKEGQAPKPSAGTGGAGEGAGDPGPSGGSRPKSSSSDPSTAAADSGRGSTASAADSPAARTWKYPAKQVGRTEPGAVSDTEALRNVRQAAEARTAPPAPDGWPQISDGTAKTFGADPQPVNLPPGTKLYRIIDNDPAAGGSFWSTEPPPAAEGTWRAGSAVKDAWNGDGGYVESTVPPEGLKAWSGPAAPQVAATPGSVLPGGQTQIWVPRGTVVPDALPQATPWNVGS